MSPTYKSALTFRPHNPIKLFAFVLSVAFSFVILFSFAPNAFANSCTALAGGGNWSAAGTWTSCGGVAPLASDDVFLNSSSGNVTIDTGAVGRSLNLTGYTGTLTHTAGVTLTLGDATAGSSSIALFFPSSGWTYTLGNVTTSAITFVSTSATVQSVNFNGKTTGNVTYNAASNGSWQMTGTQNTAGTVTLTKGTLDINSQTLNAAAFVTNSNQTRTLNLGNAALNLSTGNGNNAWDTNGATGLTINANNATTTINAGGAFKTSTLNFNGMSLVFNGGAQGLNGGAFFQSTGTSTLANVSFIGSSTIANNVYNINTPLVVTGTTTITGLTATNRVLIESGTPGVPVNVNSAAWAVSNADFMDITGSGAGSRDFSAVSGGSGDAGGNTGFTLTTPTTRYWIGNTGNWSDTTHWSASSGGAGSATVPLPQDNVIFDNNSITTTSVQITSTNIMPRLGNNIDWSAYTGGQAPRWNIANNALYGSLTLKAGMNFNQTGLLTFAGRGSATFTSAGNGNNGGLAETMPGGTLTLLDDYNSTGNFTLNYGTFNAGGRNITLTSFVSNTSGTTRTVNLGGGTWYLTGTGNIWLTANTSGLTLIASTSLVNATNTTATAKTFTGGGLTFNNLTFSGDNITVADTNTINGTLAINDAGLTNGLKLTSGITLNVGNVTTNGSAGNLAKLLTTAAGAATLSKTSGTVSVDYMSIASSTATGGATWFAGANSTNVGNNTGWSFTASTVPPTVTSNTATNVATSSITFNGAITATGGVDATQSGFAYGSTSATLATVIATTTLGAQTGTTTFAQTITGLTPGTTYYYRAYAVNTAGTSTSASILSTTTLAISAPTVTVQAASSITATTATGNGTIVSTGNLTVTTRGIVWGTTSAYGATTTESGSFSAGAFTEAITGLTCNTTYHVAAFAANSQGTTTSSDGTFTSGPCVQTLTTNAATAVSTSSLTLNATITSTGGNDATQSGFAYGTTSSSLSTVIATTTLGSQTGTASFSQTLTGLTPNTLYYFRAYTVNSAGTSTGAIVSTTTLPIGPPTVTVQAASSITATTATGNGTIVSTGNLLVFARGVLYGLTSAYGATTTEAGNFSTGAFTESMTGLTCNTTYHFAAFAANSQGTTTSSDNTFTSAACVQTVTTNTATLVSTTSLTVNATITATGGNNATQSGFAYGTTSASLSTVIATTTLGAQTGTTTFSQSLTGLTPNTLYYFRAYTVNSAGTSTGVILSTTTLAISAPTVTVQAASSITATTATGNGTIVSTGNLAIPTRGVFYGLTSAYGATTTETGSFTAGAFTESMTGLTCNTLYHVAAFAVNAQGTTTSSDTTFTTGACVQTLTTNAATAVSTSSLTLNATITSTGGNDATQSGFAYGTTSSSLSTVIATTTLGSQTGTASFSQTLTGLTPNTLYYFRAYTVNSAGTSTGAILSTTTLPIAAPTVTVQAASSITATTATGNGTIVSTGNLAVSTRGVFYGLTSAYGATTTEAGNFSTGAFTESMTGLTCNTTYHFAAFAANSQGTTTSSDTTFTTNACVQSVTTSAATSVSTSSLTLNASITSTGGNDATQSGFAYGTTSSSLSTVIATTTLGSQTGTASFSQSLTGLTPNVLYYFRAYTVNSAGTSTGAIVSTTTLSGVSLSAPTVTTNTTFFAQTTATFNGVITSNGSVDASQRGFAYGTASDLSNAATTTDGAFTGTGAISSSVTGLSCNTTYYVRAYAQNTQGTGYGSIQSFTTNACSVSSSGGGGGGGGGSGYVSNTVATVQQTVDNVIPGLFVPTPTQPPLPPLASSTQSAPLDQQKNWNLLNPSIADNFTQAPLPPQLSDLVHKFPTLGLTFTKLGIKTASDVDHLQGVALTLPTVANLDTLPPEVMVAQDQSGKIGVSQTVTLLDTGAVQQQIHATANTHLTLALRPIAAADAVSGYLLFHQAAGNTVTSLPLGSQAAAAILAAQPSIDPSTSTPKVGLVVTSFDYVRSANGVYTADITTPAVEGTYDVVTLITYHDKKLGTKKLRLTTVIDPEGYVYYLTPTGDQARISNATVSIWNAVTNTLWNARDYRQTNPQITDATGKYAFLVPEGRYAITVQANGFNTYQGDPFDVQAGDGIHVNIMLTQNVSLWKSLSDWKVILIIVLALSLAGSFMYDVILRRRR